MPQLLEAVEFPPIREIDVEYPDVEASNDPDSTYMTTHIFRDGFFVKEALAEVYARQRQASKLSVFVLACSVGTEVDGFLAHHNLTGDGRPVEITGVDREKRVIEQARQGQYLLPRAVFSRREMPRVRATLDDYGFETDFDRVVNTKGTWNDTGYHVVDATPLRRGHEVNFVQHDLRQGMPTDRKAHLIFLNNLLYHLRPADADLVVEAAVGALDDGGILSVAGMSGRKMNDSKVFYSDWIANKHKWLVEEAGLEPINEDMIDAFRGYAKPQAAE